jgi:hypothetical protein
MTQNVFKIGFILDSITQPQPLYTLRSVITGLVYQVGRPQGVITTYQMTLKCTSSIRINPEINQLCVTA